MSAHSILIFYISPCNSLILNSRKGMKGTEWWQLLALDTASRNILCPVAPWKNGEGSHLKKLRQVLLTMPWLLRKMVSWKYYWQFSKLLLSNYNDDSFRQSLPSLLSGLLWWRYKGGGETNKVHLSAVMGHLWAAIWSSPAVVAHECFIK